MGEENSEVRFFVPNKAARVCVYIYSLLLIFMSLDNLLAPYDHLDERIFTDKLKKQLRLVLICNAAFRYLKGVCKKPL